MDTLEACNSFSHTCLKSKILYIDDQEDLLFIGKLYMERSGNIQVDICSSPFEALKLLKTRTYDGVVSDYDMPGMDGITLLKKVRSENLSIPFIIFTGKGREEVVIEALNSGADFYLQKGGDPKAQFIELVHKVNHAICRKRAEVTLKKHVKLLKKIAQISEEFITAPIQEIESVVIQGFHQICYLCRAERAYLLLENSKERNILFQYGWTTEGITPFLKKEFHFPISVYHTYYPQLLNFTPIPIPSIETVADSYPQCYEWMKSEDVRSCILFPLVSNESLNGVLYLDTTTRQDFWSDDEQDILSIFGQVITNALFRKEFEMKIRESEKRYRDVVEMQTELICRFHPDGTYIFINDAYCRYFNKSATEIIGNKFNLNIPHSDRKRLHDYFSLFTPLHKSGNIEHQIIMEDGTIRWQQWSDQAIFDESGNIIEYQSVGRDITDRKTAELALTDSEKLYRTVFESTGTAMNILDENGLILHINQEFERQCGCSRDKIESILPFYTFVADDDIEMVKDRHKQRRLDENITPRQYEFLGKKENNQNFNAFVTVEMIPNTRNSVSSIIDISPLKEQEKLLRESEEKFRVLAESLSVGVYIIKGEKFVYVNPYIEDLFGRTASYIYSHSIFSFFTPKGASTLASEIDKRMRGLEKNSKYKIHVQNPKGDHRLVEIHGTISRINNEPTIIGVMEDVGDENE